MTPKECPKPYRAVDSNGKPQLWWKPGTLNEAFVFDVPREVIPQDIVRHMNDAFVRGWRAREEAEANP